MSVSPWRLAAYQFGRLWLSVREDAAPATMRPHCRTTAHAKAPILFNNPTLVHLSYLLGVAHVVCRITVAGKG